MADRWEDERSEEPMDDASEEAFEIWAEYYDELNGAPENEEDR